MIRKLAVIIICFIVISLTVIGKIHYDNKLAATAEKSKDKVGETIEKDKVNEELIMLTVNMNEQLRDKVTQKLKSKESISLLLIGSNFSFSSEDPSVSWPYSLEDALNTFYGPDVFHTTIMNMEDISSSHLIETNGHFEIAAVQPDVIVIEPLLLNDNGFVRVEETMANLEEFISVVIEESPEVFVIIQPANPIYEPTYYEDRVNRIREYAQSNGYEYLDHWVNWPDVLDEELKLFLNGNEPNDKGHEIWSDFIKNYFIANDKSASSSLRSNQIGAFLHEKKEIQRTIES